MCVVLQSHTAVSAAVAMNPRLCAVAMETRVGPDTESLFNCTFWSGLTAALTALDNVEARAYVDSRCVRYRKPLLDSGTQGTKGSTQVTLHFPHIALPTHTHPARSHHCP